MLQRREQTQDWFSQQVYRVVPLSDELQRLKDIFPEEAVMEAARPFYSNDMGRARFRRSRSAHQNAVPVVLV
ncbi:MAG: hypothetical protein P8Y36_08020 [Alphaproteobacteria bacterium]|jgi:hypothetical protein